MEGVERIMNLRDVVLAQWKIVAALLIGFGTAWFLIGIISLTAPERLCS